MRSLWALVTTLVLAAAPAHAWPDRPIQLVVPFPAGGVIDIGARGVAQAWTERLGVAVAVVNRDGAAGHVRRCRPVAGQCGRRSGLPCKVMEPRECEVPSFSRSKRRAFGVGMIHFHERIHRRSSEPQYRFDPLT